MSTSLKSVIVSYQDKLVQSGDKVGARPVVALINVISVYIRMVY